MVLVMLQSVSTQAVVVVVAILDSSKHIQMTLS
jgi:hypothetical protein